MASLGRQVLERLAEKCGGADQAAVKLGITDTLMRHLLTGILPVPDSILLKAVDVLDETPMAPPEAKQPKGPTA